MKPLTQSEIEDAQAEAALYSDVFHGTTKTGARGIMIRGFVECFKKAEKDEVEKDASKNKTI